MIWFVSPEFYVYNLLNMSIDFYENVLVSSLVVCLICSMCQGPNYGIQILSWLKIITVLTIFIHQLVHSWRILEHLILFKKRKLKWDLLLPSSNHSYTVSFIGLYLLYQCLIFVTKFGVGELWNVTFRCLGHPKFAWKLN